MSSGAENPADSYQIFLNANWEIDSFDSRHIALKQ